MFEFIEKVVYINLEHRKDRRNEIENELSPFFDKNKLTRFEAVKETIGAIGCTKSHIAVIEMAIENKWKNCLIVEDDCMWVNFNKGYKKLKCLVDKPYDVIMLGSTFSIIDKTNFKLSKGSTTCSYLVSQNYYSTLLQNFKEGLEKLLKTLDYPNYAIDVYMNNLIKKDNWYGIYPPMCIQRESYSDIENRYVNYTHFYNIHQNIGIVITTCNNNPKKLFDSLKLCSFKDARVCIVVIDDNSTNSNTINDIKEFSIPNVHINKFIKSQHMGIHHSLSDGWDVLVKNDCDILMNLDSDIQVTPDFLEKILFAYNTYDPTVLSGYDYHNHPAEKTIDENVCVKRSVVGKNLVFSAYTYTNSIRKCLVDEYFDKKISYQVKEIHITTPSVIIDKDNVECSEYLQVSQIFLNEYTDTPPQDLQLLSENLKAVYPEMKYMLYTKANLRQFIEENYSEEVVWAYDTLYPYAYKSDLARFCILNVLGGWYFDIGIKIINRYSIKDVDFIAFRDMYNGLCAWACAGGIIFSKKDNPILKDCIQNIVKNCKERYYGLTTFCPTGPVLFGSNIAKHGVDKKFVYGSFEYSISENTQKVFRIGEDLLAISKDFIYPKYDSFYRKGMNKYKELYDNHLIYSGDRFFGGYIPVNDTGVSLPIKLGIVSLKHHNVNSYDLIVSDKENIKSNLEILVKNGCNLLMIADQEIDVEKIIHVYTKYNPVLMTGSVTNTYKPYLISKDGDVCLKENNDTYNLIFSSLTYTNIIKDMDFFDVNAICNKVGRIYSLV
jgi:glycosyl transferase family 25